MTETQQLIERIKRLAKDTEKAPSTLSARFLGGGRVLADLEAGKTITLSKYEKACALLDKAEAELAA